MIRERNTVKFEFKVFHWGHPAGIGMFYYLFFVLKRLPNNVVRRQIKADEMNVIIS